MVRGQAHRQARAQGGTGPKRCIGRAPAANLKSADKINSYSFYRIGDGPDMNTARDFFSPRRSGAARRPRGGVLRMSRAEMDGLGWDECDVILVTGDAYVDHPSFGMALIGRVLEAQGFRVGIIAQPDWTSAAAFRALGRPKLFFGITPRNIDSIL